MSASFLLPLIVGIVIVVVAAAAALGVIVLIVVLRRPTRPVYSPAVRPVFSTPLERARAAAAILTREDWDAFRRWADEARPRSVPARNGEVR